MKDMKIKNVTVTGDIGEMPEFLKESHSMHKTVTGDLSGVDTYEFKTLAHLTQKTR